MIAPGATVSEGQAVMELETDKAVVEVPSSISGTVKDVRVKEGDKIKVGQVIFTVDNGAGSSATSTQPARQQSEGSSTSVAVAAAPQPRKAEPAKTAPSPAPPPAQAAKPSALPSAREFKLPELGENISQGDLVRLMIAPGTNVSEGQPVMELETDKAVVEVPSSVTGVVKEIKVKEGDKVKVGQVIFTLDGGGVSAPEPASAPAPVEHASGQHGARLAFQAAIRAEGKTEEQALPPDQPRDRDKDQPPAFSMPVQLDKVAGT